MATIKWDEAEFDEQASGEMVEFEQKKNIKQRKRKWREIEQFKEQQRMRKEMLVYEDYDT